VLKELGVPQDGTFEGGTPVAIGDIEVAVSKFSTVQAVIFSGRGAMQGMAESAALGLMELARMPALALEGGQLRHGPPEALGPVVGVAFIRQESDDSAASLARLALDAGSPVVVFDMYGKEPVPGAATIKLQPSTDMTAAIAVLPHLQRFEIEIARRRVADVGAPIRSTKVTRET
jgi:fructoselysine-6-P-deglycase FrlB-like protein